MSDPSTPRPPCVVLPFATRTLSLGLPNLIARQAYKAALSRDRVAFEEAAAAATLAARALDLAAADIAEALLAIAGDELPDGAGALALACSGIRDAALARDLEDAFREVREAADKAWARIESAQRVAEAGSRGAA